MIVARSRAVGLVLLLALGLAACAGRREPAQAGPGAGPVFGLYRARLEEPGGRSEKFRLLLFAAAPDRIHGEVLSPMGSTALIFDGGGGKVAITLVRDRVAFAGPAGPDVFEKLIGVPVSLEELVESLLTGDGAGEHRVVREPAGSEGLPEFYEISAGGRSLQLQLKRLRSLEGWGGGLGTGEPSGDLELLPLERFQPLREWEREGQAEQGEEP